jgi:hypothetical protein
MTDGNADDVVGAGESQDAVHLATSPASRHPFELCAEPQVLARSHLGVEGIGLGHVSDAAPRGHGVGRDVSARHQRSTRGGSQKARQDAQGRRLACAVGAQKAHHVTSTDAKRDVPHGTHRAVALGEPIDLDHGAGVLGGHQGQL